MPVAHRLAEGIPPPWILLHGLFAEAANLRSVARRLATATGHAALGLDLPNHGDAERWPRMDTQLLGAAVTRWLEDHGPAWAVWGHSLGGHVAAQALLRTPSAAAGLVIVDIVPGRSPFRLGPLVAALQRLDPRAWPDRRTAERALATVVTEPAVRRFLLRELAPCPEGGFRWRFDLEAIAASAETLFAELPEGAVFPGPTLLLYGDRSPVVDLERLPELRRWFPRLETAVVPGAGHWLHVERPELTTRIVATWAKNLP